jgi:hypothetical protein
MSSSEKTTTRASRTETKSSGLFAGDSKQDLKSQLLSQMLSSGGIVGNLHSFLRASELAPLRMVSKSFKDGITEVRTLQIVFPFLMWMSTSLSSRGSGRTSACASPNSAKFS